MPYIKINIDKLNKDKIKQLIDLCPFSAITYEDNKLSINAACKMCKLCIKKGPAGVMELVEDIDNDKVNKDEWSGVAVYADCYGGKLHNVTLELVGKAKELAKVTGQPVMAVVIGYQVTEVAKKLISFGVDEVYVCDNEKLKNFVIEPYANVFEAFIKKAKPSSILVGATNVGRSLAPRVAARFRTGLTADCTMLEMKENTDLMQIRPAFGGNIMAQIVTPKTRPQFCTVRYKVFSASEKCENPTGKIIPLDVSEKAFNTTTKILNVEEKPKEMDLSDAEVIVAVGRGVKKDDLAVIEDFAKKIGAKIACTRPLVESSWFDAKSQIGLSGRTVKAKLIITVGISGSVQFAAGMRNSDCIIAINKDKNASIFDIAHYGFVGQYQDILPKLISMIQGE